MPDFTLHLHEIALSRARLDPLEMVLIFQEMALIFQEMAGIDKGVTLDKRLGTDYFYEKYFVLRHSQVCVHIL